MFHKDMNFLKHSNFLSANTCGILGKNLTDKNYPGFLMVFLVVPFGLVCYLGVVWNQGRYPRTPKDVPWDALAKILAKFRMGHPEMTLCPGWLRGNGDEIRLSAQISRNSPYC
jgi:hypothetical protein